MGKKKNLHPADIERRKEAKKNVERNRRIRQTQRETALHTRSSVVLREELHKLERLDKLGQADDHAKVRIKKLKDAIEEAVKREAAKAEEERKKAAQPDIVIKGLNKIVRRTVTHQAKEEDEDEEEQPQQDKHETEDQSMIIPEEVIKSVHAPTTDAISAPASAPPPPPPTPLLDLPPGLRIPPPGYVMDYLTPVAVGRGRGLPPTPIPGQAPPPPPHSHPHPFHPHAPFPGQPMVPGMQPMHMPFPAAAGRGMMMGRGQPPAHVPPPPPHTPSQTQPPIPPPARPQPPPPPPGQVQFPPPPPPPPSATPTSAPPTEHIPMWKQAQIAEQQSRAAKARGGRGGGGRHVKAFGEELDPMDPNPETAHEAHRGRGRAPPPPVANAPFVPKAPPPLSAAGISGAQIRAEMAKNGTLPPSSSSSSSLSSSSSSSTPSTSSTVSAPPSKPSLPTVSLGAAASLMPTSLLVKRVAPTQPPPEVVRKRARTNIAPDVGGTTMSNPSCSSSSSSSTAPPPPPPPRKPASTVAAYDSFMKELEGLM